MVTAHPVPHPRETPTTGDDAGARSGGAQMGIVSGRLNHENSKRRLKVPGFEGAETAALMPPAAPPACVAGRTTYARSGRIPYLGTRQMGCSGCYLTTVLKIEV